MATGDFVALYRDDWIHWALLVTGVGLRDPAGGQGHVGDRNDEQHTEAGTDDSS